MLSLILFRHGKSDWDADYAADHERPLAQRGMRAAKIMGQFLAATGQAPGIALTSSAVRARETLDLARRQGAWDCRVQTHRDIYESDAESLLKLLQGLGDSAQHVLITGHEPACSEMTSRLVGDSLAVRFPTAAMARIDFEANSWAQVGFGAGELRWLMPPKLLTKGEVRFG